MINKVTFGATFEIVPSQHEEKARFSSEGLSQENVKNLSDELDLQTPKNYKMVLTYRDRNREEDTFVLRKRTQGKWQTVADYTTQPMSKRALSVERLLGMFNILKLKEKQAKEKQRMEDRFEAMKIRHKEEYKDAIRMFDINA